MVIKANISEILGKGLFILGVETFAGQNNLQIVLQSQKPNSGRGREREIFF